MNVLKMLWIAIAVSCMAIPHGMATEHPSTTLTLSDAIAAALKYNPQISAARSSVEVASSQATVARSPLLPQVYLSETFNHTNSPLWSFGTKLNQGVIESADFNPDALNNPDAINNFNTALTMSWMVYDGGGSRIGWQQAQQAVAVSEMGLTRAQQQVVAQAARAYVGLLLAAENEGVVVQSLETAKAQFKLVQDRFRSGVSVKSDVLRAQVRIADLEQQRLAARSQVQVAQAMLYAVMGQPDGGTLNPLTPFRRCIEPDGELQAWIDIALERRPDLRQVGLQETIAEKEITRARAGHFPSVALQGSYELNTEDFSDTKDNYTVGAVVRLNLYSGRRITSQAAAAAAAAAKLKAMRRSAELGVQVETQRAFYQLQSTWESIAVARQAVDQAEEGLRIVSNRYGSGLLTIVDLLDAQVALQQAHTRHFKSLHDYKVARIELALAAGTIDGEFK
jgi:outer membrane protein